MSQGSKIVQLDSLRGNQGAGKAVKLPAPLVKLRDRCGEHLRKLMVRLFDQVDDTFFDLADQAASNSEQSVYFDAMRDLRLKKSRVTALLIQGFTRDFQFLDNGSESHQKKPVDMENLTLVQDEALEKQVAVDNMISRFQGEAGRELEHLNIRVDALLPNISVTDQNNPLSAVRITRNFAAACEDLEMDIRAKLVFFKLFEKHVLAHLKSMLEAANKYLMEQGVIPDMAVARPSHRSQASSRPASSAHVADTQDMGLAGEAVGYGMHDYEGVDLGNGHLIDPLALMGQYKAAGNRNIPLNLPLLQQTTLLSLLSAAQQKSHNLPARNGGLLNYSGLVERMVRNDEGQPRARVGDMDQDVMNLVNMLFEYILSDKQLQAPVKAQIARLQIPIVKVALLDRAFFNRGGHPARLLLNELATAAIGWTEKAKGEHDHFLIKLEEVVLRLLNEFDNDISIFDEILQDFRAFLESEKKRRQLVEQRTRDSEIGKAKSEAAKKEVQTELNKRLEGRPVSELVLEVLREGWSSYLVLLHLKHGPGHEMWSKGLTTVSDLIEATATQGEAKALDLDAIGTLIADLKDGLSQTAFKPFDLDKCLQKLEAQMVEAAQKRMEAKAEPAEDYRIEDAHEDFETAILGGLQDENIDELAEDIADLEQGHSIEASVEALEVPEVPAAEPVMAPVAENLEEEPAAVEASVDVEAASKPVEVESIPAVTERIILVEEEAEVEAPESADAQTLEMVDRLKIGSWVEVNEGQDKKYRCKLAAIIQTTGKYIFVNRMGVKVMEKSRLGLAMALKTQTMSLLDDGLLFDRALESVIGTLRSSKAKSGS